MELDVITKIKDGSVVEPCSILTDYNYVVGMEGVDWINIDNTFAIVFSAEEQMIDYLVSMEFTPTLLEGIVPLEKQIKGKVLVVIDIEDLLVTYDLKNGVKFDRKNILACLLVQSKGKLKIYYYDEVFYLLVEEKMTKKLMKKVRDFIESLSRGGFCLFDQNSSKKSSAVVKLQFGSPSEVMTRKYRLPFMIKDVDKLIDALRKNFTSYKIDCLKISDDKESYYLVTKIEVKGKKNDVLIESLVKDFISEVAEASIFRANELFTGMRKFDFELKKFLDTTTILSLEQILLFDKTRSVYFIDGDRQLWYVQLPEHLYKALVEYIESINTHPVAQQGMVQTTPKKQSFPLYYKEFIIS